MAKFASLTASAVLATTMVVGLTPAAAATNYLCVRGDQSVRWVEVAVEGPVQNVRCEVVYWKGTEQPRVRSVLWSAQTDAAYCTRIAEELVAKLEGGGWSCEPVEGATTEAARETTPSVLESPRAKPEVETVDAAGAAKLDSARDEAVKAPEPASDEAKEAAPAEREPAAFRAALAPQTSESQPKAGAASATEGGPAGTVLEAVIEQNLVRLNDGVEGRFAADIGGYGDLDGDGLEDALVFFTYKSERLAQARFVAAYLYDGESYALAATKPVAGSDDVQSVDIDSIDDGIISLRLSVLKTGDQPCCPSGQRQQRLVLRDGQVVEVRPGQDLGGDEQESATAKAEEPDQPIDGQAVAAPPVLDSLTANLPLERKLQIQSLLTELKPKADQRGLLMSVPAGALFRANSDEIEQTSYPMLAKLAELINASGGHQVLIVGHSDADGEAAKNQILSKRRADLLKQFFVDNFDIDAARLVTEGKGEDAPIASNGTRNGREANRRVEVLLLN